MRFSKKCLKWCCANILISLSLGGPALAEDDPLNDPGVQRALRAIRNASTWFHPDLFGEYTGMYYYSHHQFKDALKFFEVGAFYADKLSQLSIGLMYMNGEGALKDPVTAYAWLDLSAERDYPDFIATRDNLKKSLTADQLGRAQTLRAELGKKYGDAAAKYRLAVQLHQGQMQLTGSRTGFDFGGYSVGTRPGCGGPVLSVGGQEQPQAGCGGSVFAKAYWDPKLYFAARDREYKAKVKVGEVQEVGKPVDKAAQQSPALPGGIPARSENQIQH